ncbi:hypothetical protein [Shinella zoogloeoides]|uniref:hypothetical protein n=1 Tax=Shinella zoogloeoides TaxID=352475 RepID=UPI00273E09DF|nr:hypothetical protein [Shinella zoogloeoides]WLR90962.1 hypothetical protein Q9316_00870 [Shinella zoogloeoides]
MRKPVKLKTIQITEDEHRVLKAILDATQYGYGPAEAAQRAEERNNDVMPVADGSEEQQQIWDNIHKLFDKIRLA